MKALLCLLLVAAASASPVSDGTEEERFELILLRNALDELVRQFLEYVRELLQKHQPYPCPAIATQNIKTDDLDLAFSTSGVKLSKAEDFTIDKISNNLATLQSSFGVTIPQAHLEGNYVITGTAFKKSVQGTGTFSVDIEKFVQTGAVQNAIVDHSLQIQDLNLDYSLSGAKFDIQGLDIEGITKEQIEEFLDKEFVSYLESNKALIVEQVSSIVKAVLNQVLEGHSLQDVIAWLKQIVASTPDPPPFPGK